MWFYNVGSNKEVFVGHLIVHKIASAKLEDFFVSKKSFKILEKAFACHNLLETKFQVSLVLGKTKKS